MQEGNVVSVNISTKRGRCKEPVPEIAINERGVAGDAHADDWHRQVSLLAVESIERFGQAAGRAFNPGDFAENVTTQGIDLVQTAPLDRFRIGPTVEIEVTQLGKKCHGDGCAIYQEVGQCVMPKEGIFCRVLRGGTVKAGMPIVHERRTLRCWVITLSDRASSGVYADRSGPRVREHLEQFAREKRWRLELETAILPDDADRLRDALTAARDAGEDLIITTGGTGIGPRDIAPDVVSALADKVIPGIMEQIRAKYAADNPKALLSRSVAAMLGNSLVFTLPGSPKAVDEYLDEIEKTLEHAIFMVHGLDVHH
ncbi:MAG TPA: MOSC domain-containing protein [Candidatus Hydrogenedentes bacterium]|nr:MOSC domain-containing protein [Candidatus Hydrogenedentota bacterium]